VRQYDHRTSPVLGSTVIASGSSTARRGFSCQSLARDGTVARGKSERAQERKRSAKITRADARSRLRYRIKLIGTAGSYVAPVNDLPGRGV
jgi:hypothetical protein